MPRGFRLDATPPQPDPATDPFSVPTTERIAAIVRILATYGRFRAAGVPHRTLWRGFATVAQYFGTAAVPVMLARVKRAMALQSVMLRRTKLRRELVVQPPSSHGARGWLAPPHGFAASRPSRQGS